MILNQPKKPKISYSRAKTSGDLPYLRTIHMPYGKTFVKITGFGENGYISFGMGVVFMLPSRMKTYIIK